MIKLELKEIPQVVESLKKVNQIPMKANHAFKLSVIARSLEEKVNIFNEVVKNIYKKYGEEVKQGDQVNLKVKDENREQFEKEMRELERIGIEINGEPLLLSYLGDNNISAADLLSLNKIFVEGK